MEPADQAESVVIFGGKGGGEVVAEYLRRQRDGRPIPIGFLNDAEPKGTLIGGLPVLGSFHDWTSVPDAVSFIAPLHKAKFMPARAAILSDLGIPEERWTRAIDPGAALASSATLGRGSHVGAFADIQVGVSIGRHVAVRTGAYLGHDAQVEDFAFVGGNAVLGGYVRLAEGAHIGPQSVIKEHLRIGAYAVVGMGSTVIADVEDYAVVAGCPARRIGWVDRVGTTT